MALFDQLFTNIFWDGEIAGFNPDAGADYYYDSDGQTDHLHWRAKLVDMLISLSTDPSKEFFILFGGEVSDGGSGTVNIAECVCLGKDSNGKKHIIHIPALTGVSLPSGWNNNRQIWVKAVYDFKLGSSTRSHWTGTTYHYQLLDTYMGDSNGYVSTSTNDLFTDSDPGDTVVILGSFTMNVTTFTDYSSTERTRDLIIRELRNSVITANTTAIVNRRYYMNSSSQLELTLPSTSLVGDIIEVVSINYGGYKIKQNAGQNILFMNRSTIPGTAGYVKNRTLYASMRLVCTVANTTWQVTEARDETYMKGYHLGGQAITTVIEDLDMEFETSKAIAATLDSNKYGGAGVSGQIKGYILGGYVAAVTAVIEDLNFSDETSAAITATLDTAKDYGVGVQASLKGYIMGGYTSVVIAVIEDMNYSDETSAAITATLDTAKQKGCGISGKLKGYHMGGTTGSNVDVIEDLNFSNETSAAIAATLDSAKYGGTGVYGPTKGYCMGGYVAAVSAVIEDFNFSAETSAAITATLNTAKRSGTGVSGPTKGYMMGGYTSAAIAVIEDMNFLVETSDVIAATLDTIRYEGAGVHGYIG
jgi:hypothetical protein